MADSWKAMDLTRFVVKDDMIDYALHKYVSNWQDLIEKRIEIAGQHLNKEKQIMHTNKGKEKMVMEREVIFIESDTSYDYFPAQTTSDEGSDHNPFQATSVSLKIWSVLYHLFVVTVHALFTYCSSNVHVIVHKYEDCHRGGWDEIENLINMTEMRRLGRRINIWWHSRFSDCGENRERGGQDVFERVMRGLESKVMRECCFVVEIDAWLRGLIVSGFGIGEAVLSTLDVLQRFGFFLQMGFTLILATLDGLDVGLLGDVIDEDDCDDDD
ncbi:hypothetical protein Tco_0135260 [Tanacetum coccineum]